MDTAITTVATQALRSLPSRHWHGDPDYQCPSVVAPMTPRDTAPAWYNVILAHPADGGTTTIRLPMHQGVELRERHVGLTMEVLIGICAERLETYQRGAWPCAENAAALDHLRQALQVLGLRRARVDAQR